MGVQVSGHIIASGILISSQKSALGNWINRTPLPVTSDNGTATGFVDRSSVVYGIYATGIAANSRVLYTSNFGVNWTNETGVGGNIGRANDTDYSPRLMVAGNRLATANAAYYVYSDNATTWSGHQPGPSFQPSTLWATYYNGSTWLAVGEDNRPLKRRVWRSTVALPSSSTDWSVGIVIDNDNTFNNGPARDVVYAFGKWWVTGNNTVGAPTPKPLYQSTDDGLTWSANTSATSVSQTNSFANCSRLFFLNNRLFVLSVNVDNRYMVSTDGVNFSMGTFNFTSSTVYGMAYSPELNQYAAMADDSVGFSTNLTTWTRDDGLQTAWSTPAIIGRSITWLGNGYMAGGGSGRTAWIPLI